MSSISTLIDSQSLLKLLEARIIAITQHTIEIMWIVLTGCNQAGKYPINVFIFSCSLIPVIRSPIDDHLIKKYNAGSKKTIAKAAVILLETREVFTIKC